MCVSSGRPVDRQDLKRISAEVDKENLLFANKTFLDNLTLPSQIIGRERKAKELVRFLLGYKQGLVVPFVLYMVGADQVSPQLSGLSVKTSMRMVVYLMHLLTSERDCFWMCKFNFDRTWPTESKERTRNQYCN
jgi:hypothetical protein